MVRSSAGTRSVLQGVRAIAAGAVLTLLSTTAAHADPMPTAQPSAPATSAAPTTTSAPSPAATPTPAATVPIAVPRLRASSAHGETTSSRSLTLRGTGLLDVASVSLGTLKLGPPRHIGQDEIVVRIGTAPGFAPRTARFVLHRASGGADIGTRASFTWTATSYRARELRWAWQHLGSRTYAWGHPYIWQNDCANFVSHALVAAGSSPALLEVSSTALRRDLLRAGAVELRDSQRARARIQVGDVVQFDWHPSSADPADRDHSGLVTAIERDDRGVTTVRYSAHTDGGNDPSRNLRIEATMGRPHHDLHGKVYFLHLPARGVLAG